MPITIRFAALALLLVATDIVHAHAPASTTTVVKTAAAGALTTTPAAPARPVPALPTTPSALVDHPVTDAMLNAVAHDLHYEIDTVRQSVEGLSKAANDKWLSGFMGFFGVLAGAGITGLFGIILQRWRLKAEQNADERKATRETRQAERNFGLGAMADLQAFRTRQLNDFYGPFRVLLSQIRVLRDEFDNRLLASWEAEDEGRLGFKGEGRKRHLMVERPGVPARGFRLIDEMAFVKKNYPDLMSTVGELVSIGDLLAEHLHKNVGLLDPRSTWLGKHIAVYLAHERVLKEIFERVESNVDATWAANYSTAYPRHLDLLIERDYKRLYRSQTRWAAQTAKWAEGVY